MHEFPGPEARIRRVLDAALTGCTFVSSHPEDGGRQFVLQARRSNGQGVGVRFRGIKDPTLETAGLPESGTALQVRSVKRDNVSLISRFFPIIKPPGTVYARVRIDAGPATLEIVCQDAEWWEE